MAVYDQMIYMLESYGFTDVILPFILIFTILFATLQKVRILGEGKRNFNITLAFAITLMVIIPHITMGTADPFDGRLINGMPDAIEIINNALPSISVLVVAVIMLLLLIGLFGGESKWMGSSLSGWIAIIAFLAVAWIFGGAAGWWGYGQRSYSYGWFVATFGEDTVALVVAILILAVIIWFITREDTKQEKASLLAKVGDEVGRLFGGGG